MLRLRTLALLLKTVISGHRLTCILSSNKQTYMNVVSYVAKQLRLLHYISSYNIQMHGKIKLTDVVNR